MPISVKLLNHLKNNKVKHEIVSHKKVFTAYDAAATLKVKLEQVVKSLLVKAGNNLYLVLLSADRNLDFKKLAKLLKVEMKKISLPKEKVMTDKLNVKPGAISAFGTIHKIPVVIDRGLVKIKDGIFQTGSFVESVRMKVKDYLSLEKPTVGEVGVAKKISKPKIKKNPAYAKASAGRQTRTKTKK